MALYMFMAFCKFLRIMIIIMIIILIVIIVIIVMIVIMIIRGFLTISGYSSQGVAVGGGCSGWG